MINPETFIGYIGLMAIISAEYAYAYYYVGSLPLPFSVYGLPGIQDVYISSLVSKAAKAFGFIDTHFMVLGRRRLTPTLQVKKIAP